MSYPERKHISWNYFEHQIDKHIKLHIIPDLGNLVAKYIQKNIYKTCRECGEECTHRYHIEYVCKKCKYFYCSMCEKYEVYRHYPNNKRGYRGLPVIYCRSCHEENT
jgi:hypothetical protein